VHSYPATHVRRLWLGRMCVAHHVTAQMQSGGSRGVLFQRVRCHAREQCWHHCEAHWQAMHTPPASAAMQASVTPAARQRCAKKQRQSGDACHLIVLT
jgi:hypothetical protein